MQDALFQTADSLQQDGDTLNRPSIHDVRNEIQAIRMGVMLLNQATITPVERAEIFAELNESLDQLIQLVDQR